MSAPAPCRAASAQSMRAVRPGGVIQASAASGQPSGPRRRARAAGSSAAGRRPGLGAPTPVVPSGRQPPVRRARSEATTKSKGWRTLAPSGAQLGRMRRAARRRPPSGRRRCRARRPPERRRGRVRGRRTRNGPPACARCAAPSRDAGPGRRAPRRWPPSRARPAVAPAEHRLGPGLGPVRAGTRRARPRDDRRVRSAARRTGARRPGV